jgi:hypothetical protein
LGCADCPFSAQIEGEPLCGDEYIDNYNGGCNSTPTVFTDVTCGLICGEAGTYLFQGLNFRDTDWYRITVGPGTFTYSGLGDGFQLALFVLDANCPPNIIGSQVANVCTPSAPLTFTGPGTFHLFAGTAEFAGVPCGSKYRLSISGPGIQQCFDCAKCQTGSQVEGEPACGPGYLDTFNGGCNSEPNVFTDVRCNTICGEAGTFDGNTRDTDWYRITVGPGTFTYSGIASGFPLRLYLIDDSCPPIILDEALGESCTRTGDITFSGPGTFYLFAAPEAFDGVPCGSNYRLSISGPGILPCQDCVGCIPGSQLESEPTCIPEYVDNYNGGCNSTPEVFTDVTCGRICGEAGTYLFQNLNFRDTDWYRITVGPGTFNYSGKANGFPLALFVLQGSCPPVILGSTAAESCTQSSDITFSGPGTFFLFAAPNAFDAVPCGSNYSLTITGPGIPACQVVGIDDPAEAPAPGEAAVLIRPNPFNPSATIDYTLPHDGVASLKLFDPSGRHIRTLIDDFLTAGTRSVMWDGRDGEGRPLPAGMYLYSLGLDDQVIHRGKAVILK